MTCATTSVLLDSQRMNWEARFQLLVKAHHLKVDVLGGSNLDLYIKIGGETKKQKGPIPLTHLKSDYSLLYLVKSIGRPNKS